MTSAHVLDHRSTSDGSGPLVGRPTDLAAVDALGAAADARTDELASQRRLPPDLYRSAVEAGLFRQLVGADLGGGYRTPLEWFSTGRALARHEASLGWVVTQGAAELAWIAAGADDAWAREVLADPLAVSASSTAGLGSLSVDGDHARLSGRWAFNTGCHGATWIGGMALVDGEVDDRGMPRTRWGWVPADRAQILDDWDPDGLRGTGSHSTVIPEQEVPLAWTFSPFQPTDNDRGPYRCLVGNGNWPIATSVAAVQLGNARRAIDEATTIVRTKAPMPDFVPLARNAAIQRLLVEAEGLWQAATAGVERELGSMWDEAVAGSQLSTEQRLRLHAANVTANQLAVRAVEMACEVTGTASVPRTSVLARCLRDAHALRGHLATNGTTLEHNAKSRFGLPSDDRLV